jgi:hypothetical protein
MFTRLFALVLLIGVVYGGFIFLAPEFADMYGNREWNEKIRMIKRATELDQASSIGSIVDKATDVARPYIDNTQTVVRDLQGTIDTKTEQAKQVIDATQKMYQSVEDAKSKLQNFTSLSG